MARPDTLIDQIRASATRLLVERAKAKELRAKWDALGGAAFIAPYFVSGDPPLARADLDVNAADVSNYFVTADALEASYAAGHATNLSKLDR